MASSGTVIWLVFDKKTGELVARAGIEKPQYRRAELSGARVPCEKKLAGKACGMGSYEPYSGYC